MTDKANVSWLKRLTSRITDQEAYSSYIDAAATVLNSGTTTPIAITAAQALAGVTVTNLGATGGVEFDLPAATVGMKVRAIVKVAQNLDLDPNGTEKIFTQAGADLGPGNIIRGNDVGASVVLECFVKGQWNATSGSGIWDADGN